jgi:hypothetical protein
MTIEGLMALLRETFRDPRVAARLVMAMRPPVEARWMGLVLVAVGSALLTHLGMLMMMQGSDMGATMAMPSPVLTALTQLMVLGLSAALATWVGRWRGGAGTFADALLLIVWLQLVLLALQVLQMVLLLLLPPLGMFVGYAAVGIFFWLLTCFVAELHGFRSLGMTFLGVLLTVLAAAFVLALLLFPAGGLGDV